MKIFDLYNESLDGTKLIEASAGTGKTFTLSGLYIRYIVEKKLLPENILVLTFTKAATAELKTRLRNQLIECKNHLVGIELVKNEDDPALYNLYEGYKLNEKILKYVEIALICFDQAAIYTINGFCQKVIDDYNSDCGSPVFQELIVKKEHVKKYVYNFWRIQQKNTHSEFLAMMPSLDDTISTIIGLLNKSHYHQIKPEIEWNGNDDFYQQYQNIKNLWSDCQEPALDYMFSGDFGRKFPFKAKEKYRDAMDNFLYNFAFPDTNFVERFDLEFLEKERKKPSDIDTPKYLMAFTEFYNNMFYSYGEKATPGNNLAISYMYACFNSVQEHLSELLIQQGQYDYSDQIKVVYDGIQTNKQLVDKIADQWQCVMVDEFQDTDSMQLEIFETCFNDGKHDLIYVGDPKQAIYDFRGADVFVYNQAKKQTQAQYNLQTNWRSSDRMLAASNAMFDHDNSFKFPWLTFTPSQPKPDQSNQLKDKYAPVAIIDCDVLSRKIRLAEEIKRFLHEAKIVKEAVREADGVEGDHTAIKPENCAILVSNNKQAIELYEYLLSVDISVSLDSDSSVFSTESAKQLYYFIRAINYPSKNHIFTTLHGLFFDVSLNALQQLDNEEYKEQFVGYRLTSNKSGLMRVIDTVFNEKGVYKRLLQRIDGERHYTDLQHLNDLLQQQVDQGLNTQQLEQWLALQIQQTESMQEDDQRKRRIESDGKKISIMTIHKSKGLEFDHVFIPYADSISVKKTNKNINVRSCLATHDANDKGVIYWKHSKTARENNEREKRAENSRNLYVALTRAKHRVYIGVDKQKKGYDKLPIADLLKQIEGNAGLSSTVNEEQVFINKATAKDVELIPPKVFERYLDKPQSIYSFSALSKKQTITYEKLDEEQVELDFSNYFQFPKGAKSGTMQHEILENVEFTADMSEIKTEVDSQLKRNHYDEQWSDCLSQKMYKIMNTDLWEGGPQMSQINNSVDEMEFMLPVGSINNTTISKWLTIHRGIPTPFTQDNLQGFLTGFIDLVFEYEGKYYVVDYKSNYLGQNFSDYTYNHLKDAIEHHYYDLQYLLYSVALVKYLQINLDGFDYNQHFGGVAYLFTRGVDGTAGQGVYINQPNQQLIESMMGEFCGK